MKTTPVSFKSYNNTAQKQNKPAFKAVYCSKLNEAEIKGLYEDGKNIWKIIEEAMPVLQKKFNSFFNAEIEVYPTVLRTIQMRIKTETNRVNELKNYIIQNNEKKFQFPEKVIECLKGENHDPCRRWLQSDYYRPVSFYYDKLGHEKSRETFMKFANETNTDDLIKDMYKEFPPDFKVYNDIQPYYWECGGG